MSLREADFRLFWGFEVLFLGYFWRLCGFGCGFDRWFIPSDSYSLEEEDVGGGAFVDASKYVVNIPFVVDLKTRFYNRIWVDPASEAVRMGFLLPFTKRKVIFFSCFFDFLPQLFHRYTGTRHFCA